LLGKDGSSNLVAPEEFVRQPAAPVSTPAPNTREQAQRTARDRLQGSALAAALAATNAMAGADEGACKGIGTPARLASGDDAGADALVTRLKLKMRIGCELDSDEARSDVPAGCLVRVLERRELSDGTKRVLIVHGTAAHELRGWVTSVGKDGGSTLIERDDPLAMALIAASPTRFHELATVRSPGRDRAGTDSQIFVVRNPLKVRANAEMDSGEVGTLPMGERVWVLDRCELADGTRRAQLGAHDEPLSSPRIKDQHREARSAQPIGWVTLLGKDGRDNLIVEWRK
jgi:hypothetical protein